MAIRETHEPKVPVNWPDGHVSAARAAGGAGSSERVALQDVRVEITDASAEECILVSIGDDRHYLHSTTARALSQKIIDVQGQGVVLTIHGVSHTLPSRVASLLNSTLQRRLTEWNITAVENGYPPV